MKEEAGWKAVHEPRGFEDAFRELKQLLVERAPHKTDDSVAKFMRKIRLEFAADMLDEAHEAHQSKNSDHAWYFLSQAAEAIGYLHASQGAVYPREDEADLRSSLRKNGSKGGKTKGVNARKIEDEIAEQLIAASHPKKGWDKAALRSRYNEIVAAFENYKDQDRKWRALLKREDIQNLLPRGKT